MDRLQTFMIYLLIFVGFFLFSMFLEGQLIERMYVKLGGSVQENFEYNGENTALSVEILDAKATRMNGYLTARVTNNTDNIINKAYLKIDLFAKQDVEAMTRYMEITNLKPGESKEYQLKFRAGYVDTYQVAVVNEFPDEDYIFEMFGYEINTKSIFGIDLSNYISAQAIKDAGFNGVTSIFSFFGMVGHRITVAAQSVPLWGYIGGGSLAWLFYVGLL